MDMSKLRETRLDEVEYMIRKGVWEEVDIAEWRFLEKSLSFGRSLDERRGGRRNNPPNDSGRKKRESFDSHCGCVVMFLPCIENIPFESCDKWWFCRSDSGASLIDSTVFVLRNTRLLYQTSEIYDFGIMFRSHCKCHI